VHQAAGFTAIGVLAGLLAGFVAARLINGLLFQITSTDSASLAISVAALVSVTLIAVSIPAARAAFIDPVVALRSE